jgi:hypothetical protein
LDGPQASPAIAHRSVPATFAAVITDIVDKSEALTWFQGDMGELAATLAVRGMLVAAAVKAGTDSDIRAGAQYRLAYEHASIGEWKEARVALSHAEAAARQAGWSHSRRGAMAGSSLFAMDELNEAEFALSDGMGCEGSCRLGSLAWLARVHLDNGSPDAALEDILQADYETREIHRSDLRPQLRAVAANLPTNLRSIAFDQLNSTMPVHEIPGVGGWTTGVDPNQN